MSDSESKGGKVMMGVYAAPDAAGHALQELTKSGFKPGQVDLLSSTPIHQLAPYLRLRPSRAYPIAVVGGVAGALLGYLLASYTAESWPLITGAMPIVAPFTTAIIVFETIAILAIVATAGTLLLDGRLLLSSGHLVDTSVLKSYPDGAIVIAARCDTPEQKESAARILRVG